MKTLLILLLLIPTSAKSDDWSTSDTYREITFQTLNIIDWGQTRYIAEHPDRFYEKNIDWAIGKHPTVNQVDNYMAASAVLHFAVSYFLPSGWRDAFQYITIADKLNATVNNASIGIKVSF